MPKETNVRRTPENFSSGVESPSLNAEPNRTTSEQQTLKYKAVGEVAAFYRKERDLNANGSSMDTEYKSWDQLEAGNSEYDSKIRSLGKLLTRSSGLIKESPILLGKAADDFHDVEDIGAKTLLSEILIGNLIVDKNEGYYDICIDNGSQRGVMADEMGFDSWNEKKARGVTVEDIVKSVFSEEGLTLNNSDENNPDEQNLYPDGLRNKNKRRLETTPEAQNNRSLEKTQEAPNKRRRIK
jgi:hypothetical protein